MENTNAEKEHVYKIILIGSAAVGKTNILSVGVRGLNFNDKCPPTLNPEFATVKVERPDYKQGQLHRYITAHIWDTAGQERYQAISSSHYRRANGALVVFDCSSKKSFKDIFPGNGDGAAWLSALKSSADENILGAVMLVENKIDKIDKEQARPPAYVHENEIMKALQTHLFRDPAAGVGWLETGKKEETTPFRVANSMMYTRASAMTNNCELFELTEKKSTIKSAASELFYQKSSKGDSQHSLIYEKTEKITNLESVIEALVLRIYARERDMKAGASKREGEPFKIKLHEDEVKSTTDPNACC